MRSVLLLSLFSDVSCMYFVSPRKGLRTGRVGLKQVFQCRVGELCRVMHAACHSLSQRERGFRIVKTETDGFFQHQK